MDPRRIAMIIFFCVAVVPAFAVRGQDLQSIADRSQRIEIPGVSVSAPQGDDWFLFPVSPRERTPGNSLIRFVHRRQDVPLARPEDARQVFAGVLVTDSGEAKARTPAEFLQAFSGDFKSSVGEMITGRQRLTGFDAVLDDSLEATCVRYSRLTEITGQFPEFPDLVAIGSTRGLYCAHPHWPQYHIDLTYQQLYAKGQAPLARDTESDGFLKSIVFTPVRPVAAPGPRALYVSHMQAADTAYMERRWPEAEVSFQAALKAAEYFGPQNALVAMTLYYLASTRQKLGRPTDAEPLFRRALDIFDTQSGADDLKVAELHGQTLNDLAAMYASEAQRSTAPSVIQKNFEQAEALFRRALALREERLGRDHPDVGKSLENLMFLYVDWSRWTEAEVAAQRTVSFYERLRGPEDPQVGHFLEGLAGIYLYQGRLAEAEPVIRRVMSIMEKALGPNHPRMATQFESYAGILRKTGREADARDFENRAKLIRGKAPKGR